ncbi:MAG: hypothetical protein K0Q73_6906 [Paenibacillus sp.]|jgi:glyoxylase-like metal-dependent hydrolase (beta-lactamase superfamily II)|nr:hypothetical protein [Paenibacillus sp.]
MVLIIDPNWLPNEVDEIRTYVDSVKGDRDLYLLFTHGNFDHIIGYKAFPGAKTIGSYALSCHPKKEYRISLIQEFDRKRRNYPVEFPVLDIIISEDAEELRIGDTLLAFYKSPGHTPDGLFTVIEPLSIWIAGDYLSDFELPFIYHSAKKYKETLNIASQILDQHSIELLVPGHGQVTTDTMEMKRRLNLSSDHLERLIKAVIAAIAALGDEHAYKSTFTEECHEENIRIIAQDYSS